MENENDEINDIRPYLDAFSFFLSYEPLNVKFKNNLSSIQDGTDIINSFLPNFIKEIQTHCEINPYSDTEEIKKQKLIFQTNPHKAFDYLLNELHKIYLGKETTFDKIQSAEINKENALVLFKKYMAQDKSYISENFYGVKLIEKSCPDCNMRNYLYKYLKTIPIKIMDINEENELDLEKCIKRIQNKFIKEGFCSTCSKQKNLEYKIKITKYPKILIFVLYGNEKYVQFKIKNSIKHGEFELIGAEIKNKKNILDLFNLFCFKNNDYKFIYNEPINEDIFKGNIPVVLFYKKRAQMLFEIETGGESNDSICSSDKTGDDLEIMDKEGILVKSLKGNKNKNKLPLVKEKNNYDGKADIIIYFKFEKSKKEYNIETNNYETFENIIKKLQDKYELNDIDNDKIKFNGKKIKMDKNQKDYNMNNKITIIISE
jgi:hypothetical protein